MRKLILLLTITILGWFGWWLGESFGLMTAYWLSFVGSLVGVVLGCVINQRYID